MVAKLRELAIGGTECGSKPFRVSFSKTWYIGGNLTPVVLVVGIFLDLLERFLKIVVEAGILWNDKVVLKDSLDEVLSM